MSDDNKGLIDLRLVVEVLRQHGRFDDEEGEVTNNLQDLIDSLATKEGAGEPTIPAGDFEPWRQKLMRLVRNLDSLRGGPSKSDAWQALWEHSMNAAPLWRAREFLADRAATPPAAMPAAPSDADALVELAKKHGAYTHEENNPGIAVVFRPHQLVAFAASLTQPTTVQQAETGDAAAEKLYTSFTDNHPTIHCNRFAPWSELGEAEKNTWRRKALKGMQPGERKEQS